jgi:hypothetical protein
MTSRGRRYRWTVDWLDNAGRGAMEELGCGRFGGDYAVQLISTK